MNIVKAIKAAMVPAYWRGLSRGVVPTSDHTEAFAKLEFATIIDVGANRGQFALFAKHRWPRATVHSFEPLPDQAATFRAVHGKRVVLHECALGTQSAELPIHVASRKDSSSLLPLGERQKSMFSMEEVASFAVPVERLDKVLGAEDIVSPALLKIDVQGFEYEVLQGAERLLPLFSHIYVEASFVELYTGQKLFPEIEKLLTDANFRLTRKLNLCLTPEGEEAQADLLYERIERATA